MNNTASTQHSIVRRLLDDQSGAIVSIESMLVGTVVLIGGLVMLASLRDSVTSELSDVAGSVQDVNLSFTLNGTTSASSSVAGSSYSDNLDVRDSVEDVADAADNCVTFNVPSLAEGDDVSVFVGLPTYATSSVGALSSISVDTGADTATATVGDGVIDTTVNYSTAGGQIRGTSQGGTEVRFSEAPTDDGTFTLTFDDPVADLELWFRNMTNVNSADPENLIGNFTVTLSDGTVLNNAAFTVMDTSISPNSSYGQFTTRSGDRDAFQVVTRGGNQYITDPTINGTSSQAAGRITFDGAPSVDTPAQLGAVGITSITFERSGGPPGYQATTAVSGRVMQSNLSN